MYLGIMSKSNSSGVYFTEEHGANIGELEFLKTLSITNGCSLTFEDSNYATPWTVRMEET